MPAVPQAPAESSTPTPEIFNSLNPSPTPPDSSLPLTCQITDLNVYVNREWGYCFAYPTSFTVDESLKEEGIISLYGPPLENNTDPARVSLEIRTQAVPAKSELASLVDAFLVPFQGMPREIRRETRMLGEENAEKVEPIPGLFSSRVVIALHEDIMFTLRFHPMDLTAAKLDLNALTQTVNGSFAFLPDAVPPSSKPQTISWLEFGQNISLTYDPLLAPWVDAQTVPAVPMSDQILFAEAHPAYAQIRFLGFQGGRLYELPLLPFENRLAQVMVFQTADFSGFGDDNPQGFVSQMQALKGLLKRRGELERCAQPITGEPALPFLPWINAKQSFCAQPQIIEFGNGRGIRYLSYYAQDPSPVLDQHVFYTFQGLTDDGQFYISAFFPVETGIFPVEPPACPQCGEPDYDPLAEWVTVLSEQLNQLNDLSAEEFAPALSILDELVKSIHLGP
jgi:hypothetical protein